MNHQNGQISSATSPQRIRKPFSLPSGATGFTNDSGQWICTGSQMGRRNTLPDDTETPCKLRMERLQWVDGDYDRWGAYWGRNGCNHVYCAWGDAGEVAARVFIRAMNRKDAKVKVRKVLPQARFYR